MTGADKKMRYPKTIGVRLSKDVAEWIPKPQSEHIRIMINWFYESYKDDDFDKVLELIK